MSIVWIMIGLVLALVMYVENIMSLLDKWEAWRVVREYRRLFRTQLGLLQRIEESILAIETSEEKKPEALKKLLRELKRHADFLSASLPTEPLSLFRQRTREEQDWMREAELANLNTLQTLYASGMNIGLWVAKKATDLLLLHMDLVESHGVLLDSSQIKLGPIVGG